MCNPRLSDLAQPFLNCGGGGILTLQTVAKRQRVCNCDDRIMASGARGAVGCWIEKPDLKLVTEPSQTEVTWNCHCAYP